MSVTVDRELLAAEALGLDTVGQVLTHVGRPDRLVVHLLIDGREPDLSQMSFVRRFPVVGRTLYIETARPTEMALDVLEDVADQLADADAFKADAADLLQQNRVAPAMEKLGLYFTSWQAAQESVLKTSQLMKIDLEQLHADGQPVSRVLAGFTAQLREIKQTLVERDFVGLSDMLLYETVDVSRRWTEVLEAMREAVGEI